METEKVQASISLNAPLFSVPQELPGSIPIPEIPVIDLADPDYSSVVRAIAKAAQEWGAFQVVNHKIPGEVIEELQRVGKEFFELSKEEKETIAAVPGSGSFEGYGSQLHKDMEEKYMQEKKPWVDFLFHNLWPPTRVNYKFWPKNPNSYRKVTEEYVQHLRILVDDMLKSLSIGLGVEGNVLKDTLGDEAIEFLMKVNYYPVCPEPDIWLGLVPHTDMCAITILVPTEVPGLQVFKDDYWFEAKYIPNGLVVIMGDQIQILSNGRYKSVLHRTTVNKEKIRMSWPVFCAPPGDKVVGPLAQMVSDENPTNYTAMTYKDYAYHKINKLS